MTDESQHNIPIEKFAHRLFAPTEIGLIVMFRVLFGSVMLYEVYRYFTYGWIRSHFIDPQIHFTFYGFGWVHPWPGNGMYWHFAGLGILAAMMAVGLFYRQAAILFCLGFAYVFLLEQAYYLNHFYLVLDRKSVV